MLALLLPTGIIAGLYGAVLIRHLNFNMPEHTDVNPVSANLPVIAANALTALIALGIVLLKLRYG